VSALCLLNFAVPHITRLGTAPETLTIGGTQPWLAYIPRVDSDGAFYRETRVHFRSSSFPSGIFGAALSLLLIFTRRKPVSLAGKIAGGVIEK